MQHTVVDGLAIFEGDIVLGLDNSLQRKTSDLHEASAQEMRGVESKARSGDAVDVAVPAIAVPAEAVVVSRQSKQTLAGGDRTLPDRRQPDSRPRQRACNTSNCTIPPRPVG